MEALNELESWVKPGSRHCTNCGANSPFVSELCLNCLLRDACDDSANVSEADSLDDVFVTFDVGDASWRFGDYEILGEIGRGGMAVIYKARESHSQRLVALKRVIAGRLESKEGLARFRREAETAARLHHPNIVPVYFVGQSADGIPFFTMKIAKRGSLQQARRELRYQFRRCVNVMTKVAHAVHYAHNQGVVHRDLKPGNILLDEEWEPLVSDFGLARSQSASSGLTRTFTTFGTPSYVAPEQATGPSTKVTAAADVYSLGAILFELLTGRPPFCGENPLAVIHEAAKRPAPKVRQFASDVDRDLEIICAHCLEREPSARYESADELAQDLGRWLQDAPIMARAPTVRHRFTSWTRRNPLVAGTLTMSVLLTAVASFWWFNSSRLQSQMHVNTSVARSVAVMPVFDLDTLTIDAQLGGAIAASLQDNLNKTGPAQVKFYGSFDLSQQSPEAIRKIGQAAQTRTLLTITQRIVHGNKRIGLRLLESTTGEPLFIQSLDGFNGNPSKSLGERIGRQVYDILRSKDFSDSKKRNEDPGLYDQNTREALLTGRDLMFRYTTIDLDRAINLFKKAAQQTPNSVLAHAYLASAATVRTHYVSDRSYLKLGKEEATKAVLLSSTSGDARRALAGVYYQEGRFAEALEEGLKTIEISGLEEKTVRFIGMTYDTLGRPDHALKWFDFASHVGGNPGDVEAHIGDCWVKLGDNRRALEAYTRSEELQPDRPQGAVGISHAKMLAGDFVIARKICQTRYWNHDDLGQSKAIAAQIEFFARNFESAEKLYTELVATDPDGGGAFYGAVSYESALGRSKQALGSFRAANQILEHCLAVETAVVAREPENPEPIYRLAAVESSLGRSDRSVDHLRRAVNLGWIDHRSLAVDPRFDAIRPRPDFERIVSDLSTKVADMRSKVRY